MKIRKLKTVEILVLMICFAWFFVAAISNFPGAGADDTWIMLWAGKTFSIENYFVNYNFEPQEISSSSLMVLVAKVSFLLSPENYFFVE